MFIVRSRDGDDEMRRLDPSCCRQTLIRDTVQTEPAAETLVGLIRNLSDKLLEDKQGNKVAQHRGDEGRRRANAP